MGYTTWFDGEFAISPPLSDKHSAYLKAFSETRRMTWKPEVANDPDPVREAVGLPFGPEGAFFVAAEGGFFGQEGGVRVLDVNRPPGGQPGLWCHWEPLGDALAWDGKEKFYDFVEWLEYLIATFLGPWGYQLNGDVYWTGEDDEDRGLIRVTDNRVRVALAQITYTFNDGS